MTNQMLPQFTTDDNGFIHFSLGDIEIRAGLLDNGDPYFIASDAANATGVSNVSDALKRLDDDEKDEIDLIDAIGRHQKIAVVTEPGLYKLILSSRKKEFNHIKRWITHDVLPAIRKQGAYVSPSITDEQLTALQQEIGRQQEQIHFLKQVNASAEVARRLLMGKRWSDYSDPDPD